MIDTTLQRHSRAPDASDILETVLSRLDEVHSAGAGWTARCPAHEDSTASLTIATGEDGRVLIRCHAGCKIDDVVGSIGLKVADLFAKSSAPTQRPKPPKVLGPVVAQYLYTDGEGVIRLRVTRHEPKTFRQWHPNPDGAGWVPGLIGDPILYRLPELLDAARDRPTDFVFVVEGEKDADRIASMGLIATTSPMGAGKWRDSFSDTLSGRHVVIIADKDKPGREHAVAVAASLLRGQAASVRVIECPGETKDASDYANAGADAAAFIQLASNAPLSLTPAETGVIGRIDPYEYPLDHDSWLGVRRDDGAMILSPLRTLPTAQAFVREKYTHTSADGQRSQTLYELGGDLWRWRGNRFLIAGEQEMKGELQRFLHGASVCVDKRRTLSLTGFPANNHTVVSALAAVKNETIIPSDSVGVTRNPPFWMPEAGRDDARDWIACRTCLFNYITGERLEPTPMLFNVSATTFDPDPAPKLPARWIAFLETLWPNDPQQIALLQEWMGYALTSDTSFQKGLLIIGPTRSGKGTIGHVLRSLVGEANVAGPTTSSLAGTFGLETIIGKSLAIISDARFSGADVQVAIERLLVIIGEDAVSIDRKNRQSLTTCLPTRFLLLSNDMPNLKDSSNAIGGRFLMLKLTTSFLGKEDMSLRGDLLAELPGIFAWAIAGLKRLRDRARFVHPESTKELADEMKDLSSPVSSFVRERCTEHPEAKAWADDLYRTYKSWCTQNGLSVPPLNIFSRNLCSAFPKITKHRDDIDGVVGKQRRFFRGIEIDSAFVGSGVPF